MKKLLRKPLLLFLFTLVFLFFTKAYYQQIGAFGCFDDCFNYVASYFMLKGRQLYSEIFFNHQLLPAYISFVIQGIFRPDSIYSLVLYHRIFLWLFTFVVHNLLILRFGLPAFGFAIFYEVTKFYFFGDRFLAEAFIVQPFVYLFCLVWMKFQKRTLTLADFLFGAFFAWFIVFMREPYIPAALFAYVVLLWGRPFSNAQKISLLLFALLSLVTLLTTSIPDYLYVVGVINLITTVPYEAQSVTHYIGELLKSFFYPLYVLIDGKWTYLRQIMLGLTIVFLFESAVVGIVGKKRKELSFLFLLLGLSALRVVVPGFMFYEAFHMLSWYGLFLMAIFLLLTQVYSIHRKSFYLAMFSLILVFGFSTLSSKSFLWEKKDREVEFATNFGRYFQYGQAMKILGKPGDSVFVDLWDDFVYWSTGLDSSYPFALYHPVVDSVPKYQEARAVMFLHNPPIFYYAHCDDGRPLFAQTVLPKERLLDYVQLYSNKKPACLFIKKERFTQISKSQWDQVKELEFYSL